MAADRETQTQTSGEEVSKINAALMGSNASSPTHSTAGKVKEMS